MDCTTIRIRIVETGSRMPEDNEPELNETAWRCLNLFFILNIASSPVSTSRIIEDSDLGYGSGSRQNDKKRFARDRERLGRLGICIRQVDIPGSAVTEEGFWEIDRAQTNIQFRDLSTNNLSYLLHEAQTVEHESIWASNRALFDLQIKIQSELSRRNGEAFPRTLDAPTAPAPNPVLARLWECSQKNTPVEFCYVNARSEQRTRVADVYGFFTDCQNTYFVGLLHDANQIRTFKTSRIKKIKRHSGTYRVPEDFHIEDYMFLPFDFAPAEPVAGVFLFPNTASEYELEALSHGRGSLERKADGTWSWTVEVRDVAAAASMALSHTSLGMRPAAPQSLVDAWVDQIRGAVESNGRAA